MPQPQRVRVSQGVTQGLLLKRSSPLIRRWPVKHASKAAVILQAEISKTETFENLHADQRTSRCSSPAAIEAVKQWKYKPYILNGEPVEVDTQITVNFRSAGAKPPAGLWRIFLVGQLEVRNERVRNLKEF